MRSADTSTESPTEGHAGPEQLTASKAPVTSGATPLLGVVWAGALIALGVVGVREGLVHAGLISGQRWLDETLSFLDDQVAADWMIPVGALVVVAGLALVLLAVRPRARKEAEVRAQTGVFLTSASIRRLAQSAVDDVDGIDTVSVSASMKTIDIHVTTLGAGEGDTRARIEEAVTRRLSALVRPPAAKIRVTTSGGQS